MKTRINLSFNYGAWSLEFQKDFDFDFAPFYGLIIFESNGDFENKIKLESNDYCDTSIYYFTEQKRFEVDVRNIWKQPVRPDVIDQHIEDCKESGWTRTDNTNIDSLKDLMLRNTSK